MSEPTDETLMEAINNGDKPAFDMLVTRHLNAIHAYAYRLSRSRADADDVAQEVFLKVWRKAGTFRPGKVKVTTWLHRIAHNACVDLFRKRSRQSDFLPEQEQAIEMQDSTEVERAIADLPLNQRTAVALCLLGNHSTKEAAHIMGSSPRAVESLISRARRTLRQDLTR
mgnify:CR=1 FL=1